MKILHVPTDVGGNPTQISDGLNALGVDSKVFVWTKSKYGYAVDLEAHTAKSISRVFREVLRVRSILYTVKNCDIVHFNFGKTWASPFIPSGAENPLKIFTTALFNQLYLIPLQALEFNLYKLSGLKMFVHFQGDDIRQGELFLGNASNELRSALPTSYYHAYGDYLKRQQVRRFAKYCEKLYYVNPDLARVLPERAEFVPYALSIPKRDMSSLNNKHNEIVVLHSPTHERIKGTKFVKNIAAELSREFPGRYIFRVLSEKPNHEILKEIQASDIAIDQLLFGWYGGFAAESMARGVPVICYIRNEDKSLAPKDIVKDLPILAASPKSLKFVLEEFRALSVEDRKRLSLKSYKFARKHHDKMRIAEKLLADYKAASQN
jgi:hypothetical protein